MKLVAKRASPRNSNVYFKNLVSESCALCQHRTHSPGLQILLPDNDDEKWEWVKPKDNAIICNVGQAFEALSGGLFKATRYRVHVPPPDQAVYDRVGALLFTQ
jgi:isopenicillin N synthase-like dioxygenase